MLHPTRETRAATRIDRHSVIGPPGRATPAKSRSTIAVIVIFSCSRFSLPGAATDSPLQTVEKSAARWLDLRAEAARLEDEWHEQKPMLQTMLIGLRDRDADLSGKRDTLEAATAKDREELAALEKANAQGRAALQEMEGRLKTIAAQVQALRPSLPPRLGSALEMSYRSLASDTLPPNERMQLVTTVFTRCLQFNRTITYGRETLYLPGQGGEKLVETLYWGLGQGYALDRNARRAWVGRPDGQRGWQWQPADGAVAALTAAMDVQQDKADPDFAPLPARVTNASGGTAR